MSLLYPCGAYFVCDGGEREGEIEKPLQTSNNKIFWYMLKAVNEKA